MALTRTQLLKELLPGLNELFNSQYTIFSFENLDMENNLYREEVKNTPLEALRNLWLVAFGDCVSFEHLFDVLDTDSYMAAVGQHLFHHCILKTDHARNLYYLTESASGGV